MQNRNVLFLALAIIVIAIAVILVQPYSERVERPTLSAIPEELTAEDVMKMRTSHAYTLNYTFYSLPNEAFYDSESATAIKRNWENNLLLERGNAISLIEEKRYEDAISTLKDLRKQIDGSVGCKVDDDLVLQDYQEEILRVLDNFIGVLQIPLNKTPLVECS